jgi:hypothetical protein
MPWYIYIPRPPLFGSSLYTLLSQVNPVYISVTLTIGLLYMCSLRRLKLGPLDYSF